MKTPTLLSLVEITGKTGLGTVARTMSQMQIIYKVNSPKFHIMQQETKNKEHSKGLCQIRKLKNKIRVSKLTSHVKTTKSIRNVRILEIYPRIIIK